ncbi:MAG: sulfotransferase, partial [Gammaproteobacteria bacterium]|nr:sulfotransferase [Gammaproteobacteria bacterium]
VEILANRLRLEQYLKDYPEILELEIRGPIIIIGLPRTGTTKLHRMLSASGDFQFLPFWQTWQPIPMEGVESEDGRDPRIRSAEIYAEMLEENSAELARIHEVAAHEPEEDVMLMQHSFLHKQGFVDANIPGFIQWVDQQDLTPVYEELKIWLQFLQWQNGGEARPWLLKAVYHNEFLDTLLEVFPDAVLFHCHREPEAVIGSWSNLSYQFRTVYSDKVEKSLIGPAWVDYWSDNMNRYMAIRERLPEGRIKDVYFKEICDDIEQVIAGMYESADVTLSEKSLENMRSWEADHPRDKHGKHEYSIYDYGLESEMIDSAFASYRERFRI